MHLTVIGSSPAWPNPGSAHSGYLLQADGSRVLTWSEDKTARLWDALHARFAGELASPAGLP